MLADSIENGCNNYFDLCLNKDLKRIIYVPYNIDTDTDTDKITNIEVLLNYDLTEKNLIYLEYFLSDLSIKTIIKNEKVLSNCFKICAHYNKVELFKLFEKYCSWILKQDAAEFTYIKKCNTIYSDRLGFHSSYSDIDENLISKFSKLARSRIAYMNNTL